MKEEEFKSAIQNMLMMQNNNDRNFEILQRQIDNLQKQLNDLNDFKEIQNTAPPAPTQRTTTRQPHDAEM